ncbi:hypothetical protein CsSME_00009673 [Camellia sinensis var. sinensis]
MCGLLKTSEENEDRTLALVKAIEKALQVSDKDPKSKIKGKAKSGAEYLASRSYHGLDIQSNNSLMIHSLVSILFILCSVEDLEAAAKLYISYWLELATTPYGSSLDATKMFWPIALPCKSHFKAVAKMRALKVVIVKTTYGILCKFFGKSPLLNVVHLTLMRATLEVKVI